MAFKVSFNDDPNKTLYAIVFQQNEDIALSNATESFGGFIYTNLSEYVFDLT